MYIGPIPSVLLYVGDFSQQYVGKKEAHSVKLCMQGLPSDIQDELPNQHRKKPNLLHRSRCKLPTKQQHLFSSRVLTTHPTWNLTIPKAIVLKIHKRSIIIHDWRHPWHTWTAGSEGIHLGSVFGKTTKLCMCVATQCEHGSFSLQHTGQFPSIIHRLWPQTAESARRGKGH